MIQFANEVIGREEKVKESIGALNSEVHGTLKLAVASIVGQNWLPQVLKKYISRYPQAKISLMTGWSSEISKSLYEDQVHIGIIRGTPDWKKSPGLSRCLKQTGHSSSSKATLIIIRKSRTGG
ncbi:CysJI operon transcriptional activator [Mycobacteroides abscessus subsp. abscessus]|nr:CysJI operon transcriptional activator [Mycobacteroides abscessus subsp. abscessus]